MAASFLNLLDFLKSSQGLREALVILESLRRKQLLLQFVHMPSHVIQMTGY